MDGTVRATGLLAVALVKEAAKKFCTSLLLRKEG